MDRIAAQSTDYSDAEKKIQASQAQAEEDFKKNGAALSDEEKQRYEQQLIERLKKERNDIASAWELKLNGAIKKTADAKGYTAVLPRNVVLFGGSDITDDVIKNLNSGK